MPVYQYRCNDCNIEVEIIHPMNDTMTYVCRKCEKPITKVITAARGIKMTAPALNSATGKPYDHKSKTSYYSQH